MRTAVRYFAVARMLAATTLLFGILTGCREKPGMTTSDFRRIKSGFAVPADTNKVWCYWYWLNDDISKEGVTRDLESMKEAGIGGAFIGNINPEEKNGRVPLFSEEWWDVMVHAVNEGKRLGVDIGVFNCPGWSQSGGPWVKPEMAMRWLVHSETRIQGRSAVSVNLAKPRELFQDVYVMAIPDKQPDYKTISRTKMPAVSLNPDKTYRVDLSGPAPIKANTIILYPGKVRMRVDCDLFATGSGPDRLIRSFTYDRSNHALNVGPDPLGPVTIALPGVESGQFRLVLKNMSANQADLAFSEIRITEEVLLEKYVEKQLGKMHPDPFPAWGTYLWDRQDNGHSDDKGYAANEVIDVTRFMDEGGNLKWDAPPGNWIVMRFGMTPTGTTNSPAAPQGKGYEVDKASSRLAAWHFNNYVGELLKRIPDESRQALKYVIADSYEMGSQNWTDGYAEKFIKRYGYDPKTYFPVLSGRIVGCVEESERFLWDLRRAVADDIAYEYVGGLRKVSNDNHLQIWLENYGHWGFPSEFLMYGGQSDLVGGEFWNEGELGNIECKAASSAAHIYGKIRTSAESFTAAGNSWLRYPALLKKRGDWSFTEGINHVVVHVYIHQPDDDRMPGINAWFSTEFNRHNTWFKLGKAWFDYERRCQHMLQQGRYAADVCYFIGEDAPKMTGARIPELPAGYSYDYINAEVILDRLSVKDGKFVLPDGMSYRLMVLPPLKTMRPEVLERIAVLVKEGGAVLGPKPSESPSLKGYPGCDEQVRILADDLWGSGPAGQARQVGLGHVMTYPDLQQALDFIKVPADFNPEGKHPVVWTHRTMPGMEIYFISNQGNEKISFSPSFRVSGMQPQLWDAVTGKIRLLNEHSEEGGRTRVPLTMEPGQSWFIVFTGRKSGVSDEGMNMNFPQTKTLMELGGPWTVDFLNKKIGPEKPVELVRLLDLATLEEQDIRYYSGTMIYSTEFDIDFNSREIPDSRPVYLDLGDVNVIARIKVNGREAGIVWMYPWSAEISGLLKNGRNNVEIEVANLWRNRLILDSGLPQDQRYTWTIVSEARPGDAPPPSGLTGPVTIKTVDW